MSTSDRIHLGRISRKVDRWSELMRTTEDETSADLLEYGFAAMATDNKGKHPCVDTTSKWKTVLYITCAFLIGMLIGYAVCLSKIENRMFRNQRQMRRREQNEMVV